MRRGVWLAAWLAGLALGAVAAVVARRDPAYAFASSPALIAAELAAGFALIASGLAVVRAGQRRFGVLLAGAGAGWFLLEWNNPGAGSPVVFTAGLVLYAAVVPLVAHAVLAYPSGPLRPLERVALAGGYGGALLLLGLLPALVFGPAQQGCSQCPANLLLVQGNPGLYRGLTRAGISLALASVVLVIGLAGWRVLRATAARRRRLAPVLAAGCAYLGLVAADLGASVARGYLSNDPVDRRLWLGQGGALVLLAGAAIWPWVRARRTRAGLARLVVELAAVPALGRLEPALARSLGDPGLRLAYPLPDGRHGDPDGLPVQAGPASTALIRDGAQVALLHHRPGLLDDPELAGEVAASARLALDNERLHAELLAQLAALRASRARIIAVGDAERRRLERDLHDGAQQRLVVLALALRLARTSMQPRSGHDPALLSCVIRAEAELRTALADLRALASGIFPAVLADEGLAAAVQALAEQAPGRMRITCLPQRRFGAAMEMAAYRVIGELVKHADTEPVTLAASVQDGQLILEVDSDRAPADVTELEDRVGALDGTFEMSRPAAGGVRIRAEIPCVC
jgi:signal transduction histidine kinase